MRFRSEQEQDHIDFNITTMLDLIFLLIFFFLWQYAKRQDEVELRVPIPTEIPVAAQQKVPAYEEAVVQVDADGSVLFNDSPYDVGRESSPDLPELAATLKELREVSPDQSVLIRGEKDTRHKRVVAVLNACAAANIGKVSFPSDESVFEE